MIGFNESYTDKLEILELHLIQEKIEAANIKNLKL